MESLENDMYHFDPNSTFQGLALVITNFTTGKKIRKGADSDHKNMKESFERLGFQVDCHKDVTKAELTNLLEQYSKKLMTGLNTYNCFAFAISSHGHEEEQIENEIIVKRHEIEMVDGRYLGTKEILDYFSDVECSALRKKPKIFLIQACRIPDSKSTAAHKSAGIGLDPGCFLPNAAKPCPAQPSPAQPISAQLNPVNTNPVPNSRATKIQIIYPPAPVKITLVPCHNDMLIMFPSPEGHYAIRDKQDGSDMLMLFSKSVDKFHKIARPANLMDILRDVTQQMSELSFYVNSSCKEYKIVPCIVHKLKKDVIFNMSAQSASAIP